MTNLESKVIPRLSTMWGEHPNPLLQVEIKNHIQNTSDPVFLNLSIIDLFAVCCRMFSSISDFYPLVGATKNVSKCPLRAKISLTETTAVRLMTLSEDSPREVLGQVPCAGDSLGVLETAPDGSEGSRAGEC